MQRYLVEDQQMNEATVRLIGDDARHAAVVMRMKPGNNFIASGGGRTVRAKVIEVAPTEVIGEIVEVLAGQSESLWRVTLAQGLPKGDKLELVLQKGTEIGAHAFVPFSAERSIVQYDSRKEAVKLQRWQKIVKEAAEQAHRDLQPMVHGVASWKQLLQSFEQYDLVIVCYELAGQGGHSGLRSQLSRWLSSRVDKGRSSLHILLLVGPEGGLSDREVQDAVQSGAICVGLGKRILRTETAGIVGLSCLMYESGELGEEEEV